MNMKIELRSNSPLIYLFNIKILQQYVNFGINIYLIQCLKCYFKHTRNIIFSFIKYKMIVNPNDLRQEELFSLFATIAKGDRRSQDIYNKCIVLLGLTRVGKSTLFNWLTKKFLIGVKSFGKYLYESTDPTRAQMSANIASKTLIFNIADMSEGVSIIDTAGFKDKRNYIGVFSVNCMLKMLFESGKQFKFVLVMNKEQIQSQAMDTLFHFINLFDYEYLSPEVKENLLDSVVLVMTKAGTVEEDSDVIQQLTQLVREYRDGNIDYQRSECCIEVLERLVQKKQIGYFRKAVQGVEAPSCDDMMKNFENQGWKYFNLQDQSVLVNSFDKSYKDMSAQNKTRYEQKINTKLSAYQKFLQTIKKMMEKAIEQLDKININFQQDFKAIDQLLAIHDQYLPEANQIKLRAAETGISQKTLQKSLTTMEKIRLITFFYENIAKIENIEQIPSKELKSRLNFLRSIFKELFKIVSLLCCKSSQHAELIKIMNFAYVVIRGLREFTIIAEIDFNHCNDSDIKIKDYINSVCDTHVRQIKAKIIKVISQVTNPERKRLFPKFQEFQDFLTFVDQYIKEYQNNENPTIYIQRTNLRLYFCQLAIEGGDRVAAIRIVLKSVENIIQHKEVVKLVPAETQNADQIKNLENCFRHYMILLGKTLNEIFLFPLAIQAFQQIFQSYLISQTYSINMQIRTDKSQIKNLAIQYSTFCINNGLIQKGIELLQQCQSQAKTFQEVLSIKDEINNIITKRDSLYSSYIQANKNRKNNSFMNKNNQEIQSLVRNVRQKLEQQDGMISRDTKKT